MGTLLDDTTWERFCPYTFIFDLEYVGPSTSLETCHIWEIGVVHWMSGNTFSVTISPDIRPLPPPFAPEFITLTEDVLASRHAVDFRTAWGMLLQWINERVYETSNVLLVSHNCFKSDKMMLEIDTRRHGVRIPYTWYFLDSLIYCRKELERQPSYTLNDIHHAIMHMDIPNNHWALPDAIALCNILTHINAMYLSGPIYPAYSTSLQAIKWLGPSSEKTLFNKNIHSVEQLVTNILTSYSASRMSGIGGTVSHFITQYLTGTVGLKAGNARSISASILDRWMPG